jgi:hypothetical protein
MPYKLNAIRMIAEIRLRDRLKLAGSLPLIQQMRPDNSSHHAQDPRAMPAGRNNEALIPVPREAASAMKAISVAGLARVKRKEENRL